MRALVTGGAGLIGANLTRYLLDQGHDVLVVDDLSGGRREHIRHDAEFCECSILDEATVEKAFSDFAPEYVYHLAAYAAEGLSHHIRSHIYQNNVVGSMSVINNCVRTGVRRLVFASSIAVYGYARPPINEEAPLQPADPYGIAKMTVEHDLRCAFEHFRLEHTIFRLHNVYGPFQNISDRYRNVIGIFMNQLLRGQPLTVFGDGRQRRAMTFVDDIVPVIAESVFEPQMRNATYNLGSDDPISILELAHLVMGALKREMPMLYLPARNEPTHAFACHAKLRATRLGRRFHQRTPLAEGLARMAEWVLEAGPREPSIFHKIELEQNLPSAWCVSRPA